MGFRKLIKRIMPVLVAATLGMATVWGVVFWYQTLPLREAQVALRDGNYVLASQLAQGWLATHPADQRAMLLAARSAAHLDQWELAEAYFAQVPLQELDDFHLRARGLVMRKLNTEAAAVFEQTIHRWPMDGESLQRLAALRGDQMRTEEALILARRLCEVPSHRVVGYLLTGMLELQFREPERAVESLQTALRLSPTLEGAPEKLENVLTQLAEILFMLGRPVEAEPYAVQARERSTRPEPCWILGRVRQQQGDEPGAQRYWEEAVARDPQFVPALRELGRLSLLQQQPKEALTWLLRAHHAKPDDSATAQALAATYRKLGQEETAAQILRTTRGRPQ